MSEIKEKLIKGKNLSFEESKILFSELMEGKHSEDSIINIWSKHKFIELRKKLCNSNRNHAPCNVCDVNGTLNGQQSFERWKSYFSKQT